ncbi:hypothetical protein SE19_06490 [Acidiplasma aeolicum]|uniref:Uncharacterized protein n=1 Tax=Acidiplasma aeolicum TaxID=507754 RepID=A0A0N8PQ60_9ARCH|nr:hypothetical protein SE19_06490 [Acidiplasma aeolicum]
MISIFTAYLFFYSFYTNVFVIFSNIYYPSIYQFLFFIIPYVALPLLVFFRKNSIIDRIYLYFLFIGLVTFIVLLATYIVYIMYEIIIFLIIAFYADIIEELYFNKKRSLFYRGAGFISILIAMLFISKFLVISTPVEPTKIVVDSIYADFPIEKVPYFFYYGIIMRINYLYFTTSIQSIVLYIILAALLTENYYMIFKIVRNNSVAKNMISPTLTGGISALSCQCEGLTATLPTIAAALATAVSTTLLSESIVLLLLSNFMLTVFLNRKTQIKIVSQIKNIRNSNIFPVMAIFFILITPIAEIFGIYFKLELLSLIFFFGINILMFVAGIFFMYVLTKIGVQPRIQSKYLIISLIIFSSIIMFIWFIPYFTALAYTYYNIFLLMNLMAFVSGFIVYLIYSNIDTLKRAYVEYNAMMFSMTALIIFYIALIENTTLYPLYGIEQQIIFSAILWATALPFMWLSTIDTLYQYSVPKNYYLKNSKKKSKNFSED